MVEQDPWSLVEQDPWFKPLNILTFDWIKVIAQPGTWLHHRGWEGFSGQMNQNGSYLVARPSCSLKVKAMSRLTVVKNFLEKPGHGFDLVSGMRWNDT